MKHCFAKYTRNFGNTYALRWADNAADLAPVGNSRVLVPRPRRQARRVGA